MPNQTNAAAMSAGDVNRLQRDLDSRRYTIVRNTITPEQVRALPSTTRRHLKSSGRCSHGGKFQAQAMHAVPAVAEILTSGSVLRIPVAGEISPEILSHLAANDVSMPRNRASA